MNEGRGKRKRESRGEGAGVGEDKRGKRKEVDGCRRREQIQEVKGKREGGGKDDEARWLG